MLFNSIDFAIFLPIVFLLYWLLKPKGIKVQNVLLLVASYIFYGWWDWRFLSLIIFSTFVDYIVGRGIQKYNKATIKKALVWTSVLVNLGLLGLFKYYNFFLDNFTSAFSFFGVELSSGSLNIILPVGISFYTFQTLSYTLDVYKGTLKPTDDFIAFAAYVSFFPQLVAGPIERAQNLLPQFFKLRKFEYYQGFNGLKQILWGLFMKVVIADNCAIYANMIFNNSTEYGGSTLVMGALFFTFQIYGDFAGYSNIAIGTARMFGFNLMQNFAFPYFSRDIAEFWRRWHISLSTWFRDYLYIPLGGSRGGKWMSVRNIFIIFIVSGFWHGANWTFIVWGALNAAFFLPLFLLNKNRSNIEIVAQGKFLPSAKELTSILLTFGATVLAWVFFPAESVGHAWNYLSSMVSWSLFAIPAIFPPSLLLLLAGFLLIEWMGREGEYALEHLETSWNRPVRWASYYTLITLIILFAGREQQFIYFQF